MITRRQFLASTAAAATLIAPSVSAAPDLGPRGWWVEREPVKGGPIDGGRIWWPKITPWSMWSVWDEEGGSPWPVVEYVIKNDRCHYRSCLMYGRPRGRTGLIVPAAVGAQHGRWHATPILDLGDYWLFQ